MPTPADQTMTQILGRASTRLLVLAALADGPRHGYAIQTRVAQATGRSLAPGTLYPLLKQLESEGFIHAEPDGRKRQRIGYRLTAAGQAHFKHHAAHWQAALARLQGLVMPALRHVQNHPADGAARTHD